MSTIALFDPEQLPVDSIAGEPAIVEERLTVDCMRTRFANQPLWSVETMNEKLPGIEYSTPTAASILLPLVLRDTGLSVLLTQRTAHLTHHAGQISFPGGRAEASDASVIETALRETEEEVGLHRDHIEVIGQLPDYLTGTGYHITPVVALVHPPFELQADPAEVAEIFEVPLAFLMNGQHHQRRTIEMPNGAGRRTFYAMPYQRFFIWGATAGILRNLFHFLRG
ncbi:MAG: CoA pyrophosphatase [Pseudomonadota bacterium]